MPTRFCLKNMGDPSSIKMAKATARNMGDNINNTITAINLFIDFKTFKNWGGIPSKSLTCF